MHTAEIKKQLHNYIDLIEDEEELMILNEAAEGYLTNRPDIIDLLTPEQLNRLDESIKQLEEGDFISHDEVLKRSREWHKKGIR